MSKKVEKKQNKKIITNDISFKEDKINFIKYILVFCLSTFVYLNFAKILLKYYNPSIEEAVNRAKSILCLTGYMPEPQEKALYLLGVFVFIISFFSLIYLFNKILKKLKPDTINILFYWLLPITIFVALLLIYKVFSAENPFFNYRQNAHDINKTNWRFYFNSTFLYSHLFLFTFIFFPIIVLFFTVKKKILKVNTYILNKINSYSIYIFCSILIVISFLISAFSFPYSGENQYDFNAIYYSVIQVYHGVPMLVDNFTNTYGLYPHFIAPLLKIFGLSVFSFTTIMASLTALCFISTLVVFNKFVKNKWLILFGFTTLFFNCFMYFRIATPFDTVFSMIPLRWILIFSLIFFAYIYLKYKTKKLYYLSFLLFSAGILWNPEIGTITYLSLIAFYCFIDIEKTTIKQIAISWMKNIFTAVSILILTFLSYELIIKLVYGQYPDLIRMFSTIQVFSSIGFGMLPMPKTFHPYMIIVAIYLFGLLISINNIIEKRINNKTSFIFVLTCIGILMFIYFIGRSHNWSLFGSSPMALILLTIFADDLLEKIKNNKALIPIFVILLYFLSFSIFQTVYDYKRITNLVLEKENKKFYLQYTSYIEKSVKYINEFVEKNDKVLILATNRTQGLYHSLTNTYSAFNPGFIDLFLKTDCDRLINMLRTDDSLKIFFEPKLFKFNDMRIISLLSSAYKTVETNGEVVYLEKRKEKKENKMLSPSSSNVILHKDLNCNINDKIDYSLGKKRAITLGKQFSVEVVFKPEYVPQSIYNKSATIISNIKENNGFILLQNDTTQNEFIFGYANQGIRCKAEINKWNYFVFLVDINKISCYVNGNLSTVLQTTIPYQNTDEPLYIGNRNSYPGFFFGDIKEIKISNNIIDNKEITSSWDNIKNNLK